MFFGDCHLQNESRDAPRKKQRERERERRRAAAHGQHPGEADRLRGGEEPHGDHGAVLRGHHGDHGPGAGQRQADDRPQGLWRWLMGVGREKK